MIPTNTSRRARIAVARTCLAAAAGAWATKVAGLVNHQDRLANSEGGVGVAGVLDRITSWAFLHDAAAFARWRADLDRGGLRKFWAMAALEAFAIAAGLVCTTAAGATRGTRLMAVALLACLAVLDAPEAAVEIVYNHRSLGEPLPSYRVAMVAGCVVGALAEYVAAMALGWDDFDDFPGPEVGGDGGTRGGDGEPSSTAAADDKAAISAAMAGEDGGTDPEAASLVKARPGGAAAPTPPPTTLVPSAAARGLSPLQAQLEANTLGFYDAHRTRLTRASWAWCAACWALTTSSVAVGAARGGWWPTHIPLGALASGVQGLALVLAALDARGPAWARRRAGLATLAAVQAATMVSTARINRSWESTATLFGFRIVGSSPPPPGYLPFQAGAWLFLAGSITLAGVLGVRPPRPAADAAAPRAAFQRCAMLLGVAVTAAGFFTCVATTVRTALPTAVRRDKAGTAFFAIDADALWLLYLVPVPLAILVSPGNQSSDLAHDRTLAFAVAGSIGCATIYAYLLTPALALGNKVGLGLIVSGFLVAATVGGIQPGGPTARAAARVGALLRSARRRRAAARRHARLGLFGGGAGAPRNVYAAASGVKLLLAGDGSSSGAASGEPPAPAAAAAAATLSTPARPPDLVLDSLLGVGSFASVYRGTFRGAPVAAKCVFAPTPGAAAPALREAALGLSLKHPNILATYAVVDAPVDAVVWPPDLPLPVGALAAGLDMTLGDEHEDDAGAAAATAAGRWDGEMPRLISIVTELVDGGTLERAVRTGRLRPRGGAIAAPPPPPPPDVPADPAVATAAPPPAPSIAATPAGKGVSPPISAPPSPGDFAVPAAPPPHAPTVLATLHDIAAGLAYLHAVGIVHGDVKPANVLISSCATRDPAGRPFRALLADFGLSRSLQTVRSSDASSAPSATSVAAAAADVGGDADRVSHYTNAGHGTMAYAAPELLTLGRLGPQADVYALAILMHEVWTGVSPYGTAPPAAVFYAVAVEGRRPAPEPIGAPPGYVDLMRACWSADLRARPSAARAAKALKAMAVAAAAAEGAASALEAATTGGVPGGGATTSGSAGSTPSAGTVASWRALARNWTGGGGGAKGSTSTASGSSAGARTATASPTLQSM